MTDAATATEVEVPGDTIEVWEAQTPAAVWVYQRDPRASTGYKMVRVGGPNASKRLRITKDDREFTQEQILDENRHHDPFTNGSLKRIDAKNPTANLGIVTDEDLEAFLEFDNAVFEEAVRDIDSELTVRRLKDLVEQRGTVPQHEILREVIEEKWKVGGTQKTVQEMIDAGEAAGGITLSG